MTDKNDGNNDQAKINFRCDRELKEQFDKICKEKGLVKSAIFRKAMQEIIENNGD